MKLIFKLTCTNILKNKLRSFMIIFSILLSTTLFYAILSMSASIEGVFEKQMKKESGSAEIFVSNASQPIEGLKESFQDLGLFEYSRGVIQGFGYVTKLTDEEIRADLHGYATQDLDTIHSISMNTHLDDSFEGAKAVIGVNVAKEYGLKLGDTLDISINSKSYGYILCDMMRHGELDKDEVYHDKVTGRKFKLLKMISSMISYSDNNYSNATLRLIGNEKSNEVLERVGIYNSRIYGEMSGAAGYSKKNNQEKYGTTKRCARLTPRDAGLILYNVYTNRENDLYMKTMNQALLGNIYNSRIPVGVARAGSRYKVAHKTGTNSALGVYNDAGIIYNKHPFILVAFTQSTNSNAGQGFIQSLSERLTRYFDAMS